MDKAIREANSIANTAQQDIEAAYAGIVTPILTRYRRTVERMEEYAKKGKKGLARELFRTSGLLDELAEAMADAGRHATDIVHRQHESIMEVMIDDDGA